jgi:hypothetical protein
MAMPFVPKVVRGMQSDQDLEVNAVESSDL